MKIDYIKQIIKVYTSKSVNTDTKQHVQQWLTEEENADKKDEALFEYWNSLQVEPNKDTLNSLKVVKATLGIKERKEPKVRHIQKLVRIAAALLITLFCIAGTFWYLKPSNSIETELVDVFIPNGARKHIVLADGTEVWINAGSKVLYPEQFNSSTRTVYLAGEAYFAVVHNPKKPFIVKTGTMDIEALGTEFNVEAYSDSEYTKATLNSGKIRVTTKSTDEKNLDSYILSPNQQLVFNVNTQIVEVLNVEADNTSAWKDERLIFTNIPFNDILRSIERKYNVLINCDCAAFANDCYSVKFVNNESIEQVAKILAELVGGMSYTFNGKIITFHKLK